MASAALYTPEILALATSLAQFGWDDALPLRGSARSRSCGSTIEIGLLTDDKGRIARIGLKSQACAIGQAAAAIFARGAGGRSGDEVHAALESVRDWLADGSGPPSWPGIAAIEPASHYPGRHGAMLLPWQAADRALSTAAADR